MLLIYHGLGKDYHLTGVGVTERESDVKKTH